MKIVIIGGHVTPALATMDALQKQNPAVKLIFFGRKNTREGDRAVSAEFELIQKRGIPFYAIKTGRLQRVFTRYTIPSLLKIPYGFFQSLYYLNKLKPDVIVSYGGYLAVPVILAGWVLRIPGVIHEQTLIPGLANKITARFVSLVALSFDETTKYYPKAKKIVVGNPIREEIFQQKNTFQLPDTEKPVVYITGGNQGAHGLNEFVFGIIHDLLKRFTVIHQTGNSSLFKDDVHSVDLKNSLNETEKKSYFPFTYIGPDLIGFVYNSADIVVGRAGVNTMCEIIALGKKGILVPVPSHSEQKYNAEFFNRLGFGVMLDQEELTPGLFISTIDALLSHPIDSHVVLQGQKIIRQDAADVLAREILKFVL